MSRVKDVFLVRALTTTTAQHVCVYESEKELICTVCIQVEFISPVSYKSEKYLTVGVLNTDSMHADTQLSIIYYMPLTDSKLFHRFSLC